MGHCGHLAVLLEFSLQKFRGDLLFTAPLFTNWACSYVQLISGVFEYSVLRV